MGVVRWLYRGRRGEVILVEATYRRKQTAVMKFEGEKSDALGV